MHTESPNPLNLEEVISMITNLETLREIQGVGYSLQMLNHPDETNIGVYARIDIKMLTDGDIAKSKAYIEAIRRCHGKMENSNMENITLTTSNEGSGISRAFLSGYKNFLPSRLWNSS